MKNGNNILRFLDLLRIENRSGKTIKVYGKILYDLRGRSSINIDDLSTDFLRAYVSHVGGGGQWRKVVIAALKRYYGFLVSEGAIVLDPTARIAYPKINRRVQQVMTDTEYSRIRDAARPEIRYLLEFLRLTGLRISEALSVERESFEFDAIYGGARCSIMRVVGKGGNEMVVPIFNQKLAGFMRERLRHQKRIFALSYYQAWYGIHAAAVISGVQRLVSREGEVPRYYISPHRLSAYAGTNMLERGVPLDVVQRILSHQSIETTRIYAQTRDKRVVEEMKRAYQ